MEAQTAAAAPPPEPRDPIPSTAIPLDFSMWMLISHWKRLPVPAEFGSIRRESRLLAATNTPQTALPAAVTQPAHLEGDLEAMTDRSTSTASAADVAIGYYCPINIGRGWAVVASASAWCKVLRTVPATESRSPSAVVVVVVGFSGGCPSYRKHKCREQDERGQTNAERNVPFHDVSPSSRNVRLRSCRDREIR